MPSVHMSRVGGNTYIDKLVHVFDIDGVASDAANEIHEPQLRTFVSVTPARVQAV